MSRILIVGGAGLTGRHMRYTASTEFESRFYDRVARPITLTL